MATKTKWYRFDQNNSGGFFKGPAMVVYVEAQSAREANQRAQTVGVYFNGSADCSCCGSRWKELWREDNDYYVLDSPPEKEKGSYLRRFEASPAIPLAIKLPLSETVPVPVLAMTDEEADAADAAEKAAFDRERG